MPAIEVIDVWKQYRLQSHRPRTLKEMLVHQLRGRPASNEEATFWALRDISFDIERGETFGILGNNGSGKSTLLKLITGITRPTKGRVAVNGRVSALLELGAGFHPDFSGRENVFLNAAILGLSRKEIERHFDSIVAFSELEAFIDNPVKTYSSGMYMRLAFSIAIHIDPDILVIDEILAVGDAAFQQKCYDQIHRFKHSGKTIVFVSHSLSAVQDLCQRAAWIDQGNMRAVGKTDEVLDFYSKQISASIEKNMAQAEVLVPEGQVTLCNLKAFDDAGLERSLFNAGAGVRFNFGMESTLPLHQLDLIARLVRADGICCYDDRVPLSTIADMLTEGDFSLFVPELRLHTGSYYLHLSVALRDEDRWLDDKFFNFAVESTSKGTGVAPLEGVWSQSPSVAPELKR